MFSSSGELACRHLLQHRRAFSALTWPDHPYKRPLPKAVRPPSPPLLPTYLSRSGPSILFRVGEERGRGLAKTLATASVIFDAHGSRRRRRPTSWEPTATVGGEGGRSSLGFSVSGVGGEGRISRGEGEVEELTRRRRAWGGRRVIAHPVV